MMRKILIWFFLYTTCFASSIEWNEICKIAQLYTRPITFLGIADGGLVSSIASNYKGVFVLIHPNEAKLSQPNLVHLRTRCSKEMLIHLGESEHFDLVFIKNHIGNPDMNYAKALYHLGEHVIVSVDKRSKSLIPYLHIQGFKEIKTDQRDFLLFFASHRISYLKRTQWLEFPNDQNYVRHIQSTYHEKIHHKNFGPLPSTSVWQPGINLMTFKMLEGVYPDTAQLEKEIRDLYSIPHPDWMPNNIIVQGKNLKLIDFEGLNGLKKTVQDEEMLRLMVKFVRESDPEKIPQIYEEILSYCRFKIHGID